MPRRLHLSRRLPGETEEAFAERDRLYVNMKNRESYRKHIGSQRARSRAKATRRKAAGLCRSCGRPCEIGSYCTTHWFAQRATQRLGLGPDSIGRGKALQAILEKQGYRCAYTGREIKPGVNASVDHIRCKAKHPEVVADLDNIEWVDEIVNRMKTDMDRDEFLQTCAMIAERAGLVKRIS